MEFIVGFRFPPHSRFLETGGRPDRRGIPESIGRVRRAGLQCA
ncbi:hypothetical protein SSAG_04076 [Streptomyces sp. Mg1]|nr:hypothetical protein SSAG_04076 [Streptomyces sp. Mg1]